jgi:signal peptidase II
MRRYPFFALVPVIFALDRFTKALIMRNLGGVFGVLNESGSAKYIFTVVPVLVAAVLIYILIRYAMGKAKTFALCLILAGALGNIYDRIFYGSVVDFLDFHYGKYHWPAFNVADIALSIGIGLLILLELTEAKDKQAAR